MKCVRGALFSFGRYDAGAIAIVHPVPDKIGNPGKPFRSRQNYKNLTKTLV
jgi:hypothetical protein